jgi:class 3 adenylate cyclase
MHHVLPPTIMENGKSLPEMRGHRTLAAIVFTDGVNFSARMSTDEEHTLDLVRRDFKLMKKLCQQFEGQVLKNTGDGLLMYFVSAVQAVGCALEIQERIRAVAADLPARDVLIHRIGIHLGDVFFSETDVMGNGVNIAARLQAEAEPGGICISQTVFDVVKSQLTLKATYLGPRELKNIQEAIPIYQLLLSSQSVNSDLLTPPTQPLGIPTVDLGSAYPPRSPVAKPTPLPRPEPTRDRKPPEISVTALRALEALVMKFVGPMGSVLLNYILEQTKDVTIVIERLIQELPPEHQTDFQQQAQRLLQPPEPDSAPPAQPAQPRSNPTTGKRNVTWAADVAPTPPSPKKTPAANPAAAITPVPVTPAEVTPKFVERCEQELARCIGPLARFIVQEALDKNPGLSPHQLVETLALHVTNSQQAAEFRQRLRN